MALQYRQIDARSLHYLPASLMHPADTFFHFSFANYYNPDNINFEGTVDIEGLATLGERDALEIVGPAELIFSLADEQAHFIIIEMTASEPQQ